MPRRVLIVGSGFSGAVLARELAEKGDVRSVVIDSRSHIGGNCHTERDEGTGIMLHKYGPHIFHTSNEEVWKYVNRYATFYPFINRVKAHTQGKVYGLPINLHTINQFFGKQFNPEEAARFLHSLGDKTLGEPRNFEEQALKMVGRELYEAFFYGYTKKQWGCEPSDLPAAILKRLPIRFNYNDSYYDSRYQGIPTMGYTQLIANILNHDRIEIKLAYNWSKQMASDFDWVFFTGPLDAYFDHQIGRLSYRTVSWSPILQDGDYQGNAVVNYPEMGVTHTRIHEHKHFAPWEEHRATMAFVEFSKETERDDEPYYPKRLAPDLTLFGKYQNLAKNECNVTFLGRLATYRYLDMHVIIEEALEVARTWLRARADRLDAPIFPRAISSL